MTWHSRSRKHAEWVSTATTGTWCPGSLPDLWSELAKATSREGFESSPLKVNNEQIFRNGQLVRDKIVSGVSSYWIASQGVSVALDCFVVFTVRSLQETVNVPAHVGAQVGLDAPLHQVVRLLLAVQAVEQQALQAVRAGLSTPTQAAGQQRHAAAA